MIRQGCTNDPSNAARAGRDSGLSVRRMLTAVCLTALALLASATPANATKYVDNFFGNPTSSTTASTGGLFSSPRGVAVNHANGSVYVVDSGKHRIQQFDASNAFVRAWGRDVVTSGAGQADEQQLLTVNATAGQFKLTFSANTTGDIAYNAPVGDVQTALNALTSVNTGGGSVTVTGGPGGAGGTTPYLITFAGARADTNQAAITTSAGTTPLTGTAVVATVNDGAVGFEVCGSAPDCKIGVTTGGGGGDLNNPQGVAVNQSNGHVYVTEGGRLRVQEYTATGDFVRAWGQDVVTTGSPNNVSTTAFEVCDTTAGNFQNQCKTGTNGTAGGAFATSFAGFPSVVPAGAPNAGNVLVADSHNQRVQEFTSTGGFVRAFGFDVVQPGGTGEAFGPALNERQTVTLQDLLTFGPVTGGTFTLTFNAQTTSAIAYNAPASAVDAALEALPNIGPGDVAVSGPNGGEWTVEFTGALAGTDVAAMTADATGLTAGFPSASVVTTQPGGPGPAFEICTTATQCKAGVANAGPGGFSTAQPVRVAADTTGTIYTIELAGNLRVQKLSPQAGPPSLAPSVFAADSVSGDDGTRAPLAVDVNPVTGRVLVVKGFGTPSPSECPGASNDERRVLELTPSGTLVDTHLACAQVSNLTGNAGIALRPTTGELYFSANNGMGNLRHGVYVADDDGVTPAIANVNAAANVGSDRADLSAAVNPNSVDNALTPTAWRLQYSQNGLTWSTVSSGSLAASTTPTPVTGSIAGLSPSTTYRVRVVTQKPFANPEVASAEGTFLTDAVAPEIRTTATQSVAPTTATASARVNPHGTPTSYRFEWGEQGSFDHVSPIPDGTVGSGPGFVLVEQQLTGLEPGTTYQYRVVAVSASEGATVGATETFTTPALAAQSPTAGRAYELVSPADKVGGSGVGTWYAGVGSHATAGIPAYNRDRYASASFYGASLADGGFSYGTDWTLGERTPTGWVNRSAMSRQGGFGSSEFAKLPLIQAASDDLSLTAWQANSQMQIFQEQADEFAGFLADGAALQDWESGRWEIVAPLAQEQQVGPTGRAAIAPGGGYALAFGLIRGVSGSGDPTHPSFVGDPSDLVCPTDATCNRNVYVDDVTAGLSDSFPGDGIRSLVNICTGAGASRTAVPSIDGGGKLVAEPCPAALAGRDARLISPRGASLASNALAPGQISEDGSRIFFMSPDHLNTANDGVACAGTGPAATACPPQVYVRQRNTDGSVTTRWISQSTVVGQNATLTGAVVFEGATPDGDKVFFRTTSPLTVDDPNGGLQVPGGVKAGTPGANSSDLYMYDLPNGPDGDPATPDSDPAGGTLTRISAGPSGDGDGNVYTDAATASARNALRALGADGARVYFVTAAPLPGVPDPANGTITVPGGTVSQTQTKNLYVYDATQPGAQRWRFVARLPADSALGVCATKGSQATSDGLQAGGNATGVDGGVEAGTGGNCVRATADGGFVTLFTDGRLTADDPDSATGDLYAYDSDSDELVRVSAPQGGIGGSYACVTSEGEASMNCHGDPFISSLSSRAPLNVVTNPADPTERTVFFESASRLVPHDHNDVYDVYQWRNGKLSLISTGASGAADALYRGSDRTGKNVYVSTRDALTWQDHDAVLDVYTARVGGGIDQPAPTPVCSLLSDGCQSQSPNDRTPANTQSTDAGDENASAGSRTRLGLSQPSARAKRRAARSGALAVRVRSDGAGTASIAVTARIGGKQRRVARSTVAFEQPGAKRVSIRLSRAARKRLAAGNRLVLRLTVTAPDARPGSLRIALQRTGR